MTEFRLEHQPSSEGVPSVETIARDAVVGLTPSAEGYTVGEAASRRQMSIESLNLSLVESGGARFSREALEEVNRAVVRAMNQRGFIGVLVSVAPEDLSIDVRDPTAALADPANVWTDLRPGQAGPLRLHVHTARVVRVRTVASGERVPPEQSVDNPVHERIRANSPIRPAGEEDDRGSSLLRKDLLDAYTLRLNRHPGRRVDVAVSASDEPGEVVLDYLVRENKPWFIFGQVANNGTEQTETVRERFGIVHNQLTGRDDQLVIDYVTAGFSGTHAVVGSYEFPVLDRLRLRAFATYSKFDASQVGFADEDFRGESWSVGGEAAWNVLQHRELFLDLLAGIRWESMRVNNQAVDETGHDGFFLPSLGARLERFTDESSTEAYARAEWNLADIAATGDPSLENLGRTDPDRWFTVVQWGAQHSFYLEPLLDAQRFRAGKSTLAHEVALRFRGQHSLGSRLAPTFQDVVGGMNTVRGYPESAVAGDNVYVGSVEYRLHLPRLFDPYDERGETPPTVFGSPFRMRPQTRYARPDWDLIGKVFLDAGTAENADRQPFESDETLISTGLGIELFVGKNINLRVDWGVVLSEVEEPTHVTPGSSRVHFVVTVLF